MSAVSFEVTRTRGDILKGIAANTLRSPGTLAWYVGGSAVVAGIAVWVNRYESAQALVLIGLLAFAAMLALYTLILAFCVLLAARKTWALPGASDPVTYTLSKEGLGVLASTGHGLTAWATWKAAFESASLIVIRHQLNLIHIIPKRGMTDDTLHKVRSVLRANVKNVRLQPAAVEPAP
ncbi:MAG TPA: YcxB family protein [Vitreimonas sp.]|uniref:YcxB family protein n=1 Tax=Vitreimonas sp. TaxID=3069702 RepID=UPI002D3E9AD1|nr:YcxB family protein [Vitreimonas sp.]HYD86140.1 YcxB family protein [Vitreimonas sp.]